MKRTRILSIVLILLMIISAMPLVTAHAETNVFGWEVPAEPIEFSMFHAYDNWAPSEETKAGIELFLQYLKDEFNVHITLITTDGDASERANLMLAANDYPDMLFSITTEIRDKFVTQGKAIEMTPYLDTVAPLMKDFMGNLYGMYLNDEDKLFYVPTAFGALMELPDYSAHLRYDEWLEIGSPEIKTPDDYYNAVMAILEKHPTTPNGDTRWSMSMYGSQNSNDWPVWYGGYWGLKKGWKIDDEGNFTYWTNSDEGKAMSAWFNKLWRTGTMDPDSFVNKHEDWRTKFSNKRIVGAIGGWWIGYNAGHEIWMLTDPDWTEEQRTIQVGFKAPEAEAAYVTGKNRLGDRSTIITDKAKDPEGIMKWLNFQATTPGRALVNWGLPGDIPSYKDNSQTLSMWYIESPEEWHFSEVAKEQLIAETFDYPSEGIFGANEGTFQHFNKYDRWEDGIHSVWANQMWYDQNKWKTIMMENMAGTIYDATAMEMVTKPDDYVMAETSVRDAWKQLWPVVVQAESDEAFEEAWANLQSAVEMADVAVYQQYMQDNYKINMEKLG